MNELSCFTDHTDRMCYSEVASHNAQTMVTRTINTCRTQVCLRLYDDSALVDIWSIMSRHMVEIMNHIWSITNRLMVDPECSRP
jgi:hypothetical protein